MSVKQISVFLENKPGSLLDMTKKLAENGIDMRAFSLAETSEFGIARILVDDVLETIDVLKEAGYVSSLTSVLAIKVSDTPGSLNQVLALLSDAGINVEYMYAFAGKGSGAYMVLRVADEAKASGILTAAGILQVEQDQLKTL